MSVQKKSLISQRNAVTKAIVATTGEKHATPKVAPKVAPKQSLKIATCVKSKLSKVSLT